LDESLWNRSHNQFLTFWVSFGIFGLISFLLIWYFSLVQAIQSKNWMSLLFILIALTSFISEDTLETQQGVTFVAFFLGVLPFLRKNEMK
jgi:O-antigen ligase